MKKILLIVAGVVVVLFAAVLAVPRLFPKKQYPLEQMAEKHAAGKFVKVDGKKVHYVERGRGRALVLIHGFYYHTIQWEKNMAALARNHRVVAMDLWGWGYSERLKSDAYSFELYARQVTGLMDALGIPKAVLFGQSMGGGIAVYTAARYPARVEKLVLSGPAVIPYEIPADARVFVLPLLGEFVTTVATDGMLKDNVRRIWFYDGSKIGDEYTERVIRPLSIEGTIEGALNIQRYMLAPPVVEKEARMLASTGIPVLIAHGREDRAVPLERSQRLREMWKNSRLEVFEKAGHSPHEEHAEKFNRLALEFIKGN